MKTKIGLTVKNFHTHELKAGKKKPEEATERGQRMREQGEPIRFPPRALFFDPN